MHLSHPRVPLLGLAAFAALGLAVIPPAQAQTPGLTITQTGFEQTVPLFSLGYEFTTTAPVTVDALGYFTSQSGVNALTEDHPVSIYDTKSAALLASGTVSHTAASFVNGYFVYTGIAPVTLAPGDYIVTGASGNDPYAFNGSFTTDARINFVENRFNNSSSGDSYPPFTASLSGGQGGFFGGSFALAPAAVPEPSSVASMGLGGVGLLGLLLRARKRRTAA